ncbi:MAG: SRPBCC family protein [Oscillatoriales cyanobacterium RM2_1_1]|nr:SRPBCC family protein [Oscillatoriales cyanobacterium SM2_3_0]NJO44606.1 SRPBCC family protein [Oscillatoriales cyanobacterium RM2_1_1]
MLHFQYDSLVNAPLETVWQFHERSDILQLLTPPWQPVKVVRREGGLGIGAITEFLILLGPIPIRWLAVHTECDRPYLFTDEQQKGPMESWVHRHQFSTEQGQTRLRDVITFAIPGGWLVEQCLGWWVKQRLEDMFRYRHQVTKQECER